ADTYIRETAYGTNYTPFDEYHTAGKTSRKVLKYIRPIKLQNEAWHPLFTLRLPGFDQCHRSIPDS
ncbi:MAG: hypothetical protein IJV02_00575, partial [Candidatus Methanomethylophilaceae archaeon]|nr:hypothetical protein [Candidatus Methanomethylophilaceae archaeon]